MKRWLAALAAAVMLVLAATAAPSAGASETQPAMCEGRADANVVLVAHANGAPSGVPKFILNVWTDAGGQPYGTMVLGRGGDRIEVTDWCRLWKHIPGEVGQGEDSVGEEEGATVAHVVGIGYLRDGTQVAVRADVRGTEEGDAFRVRYRPWPAGHEGSLVAAAEEDEGWIRVPAEGWYPLDQLQVR